MLINALELNYDNSGAVTTISVTDENQIMNVTPNAVLDAIINGRMVSQNIRLAIYGLDVAVNGQIVNLYIDMDKNLKDKVKSSLGLINNVKKSTKPKDTKSKEKLQREQEIENERQRYLERQAKWLDENRRKAEEAREKGLVNLTPEESKRLRQEYFKTKKN